MLSISEDPDRAFLFQPHNVKPPLYRLIFTLHLSSLQPTFYLSGPPFYPLTSLFPLYPSPSFSPSNPDAAEESKAEEATPADAVAEATESKDD